MSQPAGSKRPYRPDDLYQIRQIGDPQVSPDGATVAYVVTTADREADDYCSHLWLASINGGEPVQLTRGPQKDHSPRWSPDGRLLAFVSNRKFGGDSEPRNEVWLLGRSGEPWRLTQTALGAINPVWSPDGSSVLFSTRTRSSGQTKARSERTPLEKNAPRVLRDPLYRFDGEGQFSDEFRHFWRIPSAGGTAEQLTCGDWHDYDAVWSPDGANIAFTSNREANRGEQLNRDLWLVTCADGSTRKLTAGKGPCLAPVWSPDGTQLAYAGHERGETFSSANTLIFTLPASGGDAVAKTATLDRGVLGVAAGTMLAWTDAGLFTIITDGGAARLYRIAPDGSSATALTGEGQYVTALAPAVGGETAFTAMSATNPGELFYLPAEGSKARPLTHHHDALIDEVHIAQLEPFCCTGADGWEIAAWLLKPYGYQAGQRYPLVLEVHGGPHGMHGQTFALGAYQSLAAQGYAVLLVNPRGSSGYGEAFSHAVVGDWGGKDFGDLMAAVDQVIAQGIADPERLAITGYSYGGFMTSWTVGHTDRFKAAVCGAPVAELLSFYGESDIGTTFGAFEHGGPLWERRESYREHSPLSYIENCTTPFLLLHWEGDLRCPISQSEQLFAVLCRLHREVEFVRYPGGFHTYVTHSPSQRVDAMRRTAAWFDDHLAR